MNERYLSFFSLMIWWLLYVKLWSLSRTFPTYSRYKLCLSFVLSSLLWNNFVLLSLQIKITALSCIHSYVRVCNCLAQNNLWNFMSHLHNSSFSYLIIKLDPILEYYQIIYFSYFSLPQPLNTQMLALHICHGYKIWCSTNNVLICGWQEL